MCGRKTSRRWGRRGRASILLALECGRRCRVRCWGGTTFITCWRRRRLGWGDLFFFPRVVGGGARRVLLGRHNVYNVLAAAAIALEHSITPSEIAAALPSLQPADKRGQVVQVGNITVLYDCYNSSPKALMAAVDTLAP